MKVLVHALNKSDNALLEQQLKGKRTKSCIIFLPINKGAPLPPENPENITKSKLCSQNNFLSFWVDRT